MTASLVSDLSSLTPLIIATLGFGALWTFRKELKLALTRLSRIEASRKDTSVSANLEHEGGLVEQEPHGVSPADKGQDEASADKASKGEISRQGTEAGSLREDDDVAGVRDEMMMAYLEGDKALGDTLCDQLQGLEADAVERRRDRVRSLAMGFMGGIDDGAVEALEDMAETDEEISGFTYRMIGMCLDTAQKPVEAAEAYRRSEAASRTPKEAADSARLRAASLVTAGEARQGIDELTALLPSCTDRVARVEIWEGLAAAYAKTDELESRALALHEAALLAGTDARKWFRAAYAFSKADSQRFATLIIHCYQAALRFEPDDETSLNNLGVVLVNSGLKLLGTERYRAAAREGNTLAMANLAQNYLYMGFAEEAEALIKGAAARPNPHEKVAKVNAELATARSDQASRLKEISEDGARLGQLMRDHVEARLQGSPEVHPRWELGSSEATVERTDSRILITWEDTGFMPRRQFTGEVEGSAIAGKFEKEKFSPTSDINWARDGFGYGSISPDGQSIEVAKLLQGPRVEFLTFRAARDES